MDIKKDIKKIAPWNWFKNEEDNDRSAVPATRHDLRQEPGQSDRHDPVAKLHRGVERIFDNTLRDFGLSLDEADRFSPLAGPSRLKPKVDISSTDSEYTITAEVPGISKDDIKVELENDTMIIRGEKKQEKEEEDKDFYRVERSYGSFQRILNLPVDADTEKIDSSFKKGVLTVKIPRKPMPSSQVKQVEIKG